MFLNQKRNFSLYLTLSLASTLQLSCSNKETTIELSDIIHEDVVVTSKYHEDEWLLPIVAGKVLAMIPYPEINQIIFDGKVPFTLYDATIYNQFNKGQQADLSYKEKIEITSENNSETQKKEISRSMIGYQFESVYPK